MRVKKTSSFAPLAMGVLFAAIGFSYAVATTEATNEGLVAVQRSVGASDPLRFTNPFIAVGVDANFPLGGDQQTDPDGFDLGDACYGSMITRYVTATGGVRPYTFSSTNLDGLISGTGSTLELTPAGLLVGTVAPAVSSPMYIHITVTDSSGTNPNERTGIFRLALYTCSAGVFRFAMDQLPGGQLGRSYSAKLETLGGVSPVVYSEIVGSLTIDGVSQGGAATLQDIVGLNVFEDGTVAGRPLKTGTITFTARAVDALDRIAKNRTNTANDQTVTLVIEDTDVVSTDLTTLSCIIKGDTAKPGKHKVKYRGLINIVGVDSDGGRAGNLTSSMLVGNALDFRVGDTVFNQTTPSTGQKVATFDTHAKVKALLGDGTRVAAKLNVRNGQLKIGVKKTDVTDAVDAITLTDGQTKTLVLQIAVGNIVTASELLEFVAKVRGTRFTLTYKLGKTGRPLGGAFQLAAVRGKDKLDLAGNEGDQWKVKFVAVPRFGIDSAAGLNSVSSVVVRLGAYFSQTITSSSLTSSAGGGIRFANKEKYGIKKLKVNPVKYIHLLLTHPIAENMVGIPPAYKSASSGGSAYLPFGFDLYRATGNDDFSGESARSIAVAPRNSSGRSRPSSWVDKAR